jgi:hypothetical protein
VPGTDNLLSSLRERRVPVVVIKCDDDLTQALSVVSNTINTKDMSSWQSPILSQ